MYLSLRLTRMLMPIVQPIVIFAKGTVFLSQEFLQAIIDSIPQRIAVIEYSGRIVYVNKMWNRFAEESGLTGVSDWSQFNYLDVCQGAEEDASDVTVAGNGIRAVIFGRQSTFEMEYPCPDARGTRWFQMTASVLEWSGEPRIIISHLDITDRMQAERDALEMAYFDMLTGLPNRRRFDDFSQKLWRRHRRSGERLAILMIDLDEFKAINDSYGHVAGDACLQRIGEILSEVIHRPDDIAARFGGDEFVLALGGTGREAAQVFAEQIIAELASKRINYTSGTIDPPAVSIGITTAIPSAVTSLAACFREADNALYEAKAEAGSYWAVAKEDDDGGAESERAG